MVPFNRVALYPLVDVSHLIKMTNSGQRNLSPNALYIYMITRGVVYHR